MALNIVRFGDGSKQLESFREERIGPDVDTSETTFVSARGRWKGRVAAPWQGLRPLFPEYLSVALHIDFGATSPSQAFDNRKAQESPQVDVKCIKMSPQITSTNLQVSVEFETHQFSGKF